MCHWGQNSYNIKYDNECIVPILIYIYIIHDTVDIFPQRTGVNFKDMSVNVWGYKEEILRQIGLMYVLLQWYIIFVKICTIWGIYFGTYHQMESYTITHSSPT